MFKSIMNAVTGNVGDIFKAGKFLSSAKSVMKSRDSGSSSPSLLTRPMSLSSGEMSTYALEEPGKGEISKAAEYEDFLRVWTERMSRFARYDK